MAIIKPCVICGKNFPCYDSGRRATCSHECAEERKRYNELNRKPKPIAIRYCIICKKELVYHQKKYCSEYCKSVAPRKKIKQIKRNPPEDIQKIKELKIKCCRCKVAYGVSFYNTRPYCRNCWSRRKEDDK